MEIKYESKQIEKMMSNMSKLVEKIGFQMARNVKKRYNQILASKDMSELLKNNLGHPHPLHGDLKGCYGIDITANYRLVVQPNGKNIIIVKGVMDYHGEKYNWIIP